MIEEAGAGGEDILADVVRIASDALGERLVAGYALGSLAHGGFSPAVSDVDVALILADPALPSDRETVAGIVDTARAVGSPLHSRVSIFWSTPGALRTDAAEGRFPPLDRLCLYEHGRLLTGADVRDGLPRPSRAELVVAGARFALDGLREKVVAAAPDPAGLLADGVRATTKAVLFPARFRLTGDTGREGTNDAAVQHYCAHHHGPDAELVRAAFDWRTHAPVREHAAALLDSGFVPLYDGYLADQIQQLRRIGESELAERFADWRSRLPVTS